MAASKYRINDDGSVTQISSTGSKSQGDPDNNKKPSGNNGWIWLLIILGLFFYLVFSLQTKDSELVPQPRENEVKPKSPQSFYGDLPPKKELSDSSYLNVSKDDILFSADGGTNEIEVNASEEWRVEIDVANWGRLFIKPTSIILNIEPNLSTESRDDYFTIRCGNIKKRINIHQAGKPFKSSQSKFQEDYDLIDYYSSFICIRCLENDEVETLTKHQLRLIRNTIFALNRRKFKSEDLQTIFNQFSWYSPIYNEVLESELSDIEQYNVSLIQLYE